MTLAELHDAAWRDEYEGQPWPSDPPAVYILARERAREARQSGAMIRAILRFIDMPKAKCS